MAPIVASPNTAPRFVVPAVRRISVKDLDWALAAGWQDFTESRGELLLLALIYPGVAFLTAAAAFDARLLPLLFPAAAGLSILGPAVASGFFELARRRTAGLDASWRHFLEPLNDQRRWPLLILTGGLFGLFALWIWAAGALYGAVFGVGDPTLSGFTRRLFTTPEGWTLIMGLVSFPLVVDRGVDPGVAIAASIAAAVANPLTVAAWGLRVAALLVLGALPAFVGLAVVVPVLGYASWRLYTRLVA
jgi:uncharacterized membrane protein